MSAFLYVVNGDAGHLDGWTVPTLAAALRPALAPLGIDVVEKPTESGLGGLRVLGDLMPADEDRLREEVRRIVDRVTTEPAK